MVSGSSLRIRRMRGLQGRRRLRRRSDGLEGRGAVTATAEQVGALGTLEHDALFYANDDEYVAGVLGFVREGLERDEPVLVAVPGWNLDLLREGLTPEEMPRVRLRDMTVAGRNPGRIIGTVLTAFVREHADRRVRIVGEPIWAGRTDEEYPACAEHEALINVALGSSPAYIQCPYDTAKLPSSVLTDATRTHPMLATAFERWTSPTYTDPGAVAASFDSPLSPVPGDAEFVVIGPATGARSARVLVHDAGQMYGMDADRLTDVRLVAQELAVNTLTHSPNGRGVLEVWTADDHLVLQVEDGGRITDPLVGRRPPEPPHVGHGLFVVHQLADLVRIHRDTTGTTVRAYFRLP
jgi:anti-sigma regulatory factor (Ser/Thr protein kinase)